MTTTRRGFLAAILAAGAAPAIVQAGSIMRIVPPKVWTGLDLAKDGGDFSGLMMPGFIDGTSWVRVDFTRGQLFLNGEAAGPEHAELRNHFTKLSTICRPWPPPGGAVRFDIGDGLVVKDSLLSM